MNPRGHLPRPGEFRNDAGFQKRLDAFFIRSEGRPALEVLAELAEKYDVGGAPPYITIRSVGADRNTKMIVVRHSETGDQESTEIPAGDMTKEEAAQDSNANAVLTRFAEDKLFELQVRHAPATVMYATAIRRYLDTRDPNTGDEAADAERRRRNRENNVRDPQTLFDAMSFHAELLIEEFFQNRRLKRHKKRLPKEIKKFLVMKSLKAGATMDKYGQVTGALDSSVAAYISVVRQTLDWLADAFHPPIDLSMDSFVVKSVRSDPLRWTECRTVMLWCQGYEWDGRGFVRQWVMRDAELRLEYKKLPEPRLSEHRAEFRPLLRLIPSLATTGSRPTVGSNLCWKEDDHFGYIKFDGVRSRIFRTGTFGPSYQNKPRLPSFLTPLARGFFAVWHAKDLRESERTGWPLDRVIHNGRGGAVTDPAKLFKRACEAVGIQNSARKLKHLAVTMHWFAGYELLRIGLIVGTKPETVRAKYLYLENEYQGLMRPRPNPATMTFVDFADPSRDIAKIPRAPAPARPGAPVTRSPAREAALA